MSPQSQEKVPSKTGSQHELGRYCSGRTLQTAFHGEKGADHVRQVLEAVKDRVGAKVFGRYRRITEPDGKDGDARSPCGGDVGLAVSDHDGEWQRSTCLRHKLGDVARIRFVERKRIAASSRIEKTGDPERGQQLIHKPVELIRTKRESRAAAAHLSCGFEKAGEQRRLDCDMAFVMLNKALGEPLRLRRIGTFSGRAKRMVQHRFRPISHALADRLRACGPEAFGDQGGVRRIDEIGRSVGDRPIEVENNRGTVNGRPPSSVRLGVSAAPGRCVPSSAA